MIGRSLPFPTAAGKYGKGRRSILTKKWPGDSGPDQDAGPPVPDRSYEMPRRAQGIAEDLRHFACSPLDEVFALTISRLGGGPQVETQNGRQGEGQRYARHRSRPAEPVESLSQRGTSDQPTGEICR